MSCEEIAIKATNLSNCSQISDEPQDRLKQSIYPGLQRLVGQQPTHYCRVNSGWSRGIKLATFESRSLRPGRDFSKDIGSC
jgi:hypothetical protein